MGDDRNALLMLTVHSEGGPFGNGVLPGARLYLLDAEHKIAAEQVIFFMSAD